MGMGMRMRVGVGTRWGEAERVGRNRIELDRIGRIGSNKKLAHVEQDDLRGWRSHPVIDQQNRRGERRQQVRPTPRNRAAGKGWHR